MKSLYLGYQPIYDIHNNIHGYELLYRDSLSGIKDFPGNIEATVDVISKISCGLVDSDLFEKGCRLFINCEHNIAESNMIRELDKDKFVIEILETTQPDEEFLNTIKELHEEGYVFALDDFDCSPETLKYFYKVFQYLTYIKVDIMDIQKDKFKFMIPIFKKAGLKVITERVETLAEVEEFIEAGTDFLQGFYLCKPKVIIKKECPFIIGSAESIMCKRLEEMGITKHLVK